MHDLNLNGNDDVKRTHAAIKAMATKGTFDQISAKWKLTGKLVLPKP